GVEVVGGARVAAVDGAWVAVRPGTDRDPAGGPVACDRPLVDDAPSGIEQVERDGAAAITGVSRSVDPRHRLAVAVAQRGEPVDEPAGQARHPLVDQVDPDVVDPGQPGLQVGYLQ